MYICFRGHKLSPKGRAELKIGRSRAKHCVEFHGDLRLSVAPQNPTKNTNLVASGSLLGCLWNVLGASWAVSGTVLGASWGVLGVSWGVLDASKRNLGPFQARLEASWARLGGHLARLARMFAF